MAGSGERPQGQRDERGQQLDELPPAQAECPCDAFALTGLSRRGALRECVIIGLCLLVAWLGPQVWYSIRAPRRGPVDLFWTWLLPNVAFSTTSVGLALLLTMRPHGTAGALGLRRDRMEGQVLWGVVGGVLAYALFLLWLGGDWLVRYAAWCWGHRELISSEAVSDPGRAWDDLSTGVTLAMLVAASAVEETAFRGLLLPRLRGLTGRWWSAVAISGVLFGVWHVLGGLHYVLQTALVSVAFSLVFICSRSLVAAVVAHGLYNAAQMHLGAWWSTGE